MKKIRIAYGIYEDPMNLPENFDDMVLDEFKKYTTGTAHEYTFCDQLLFIDNCIEYISKATDDSIRVSEILEDRIMYEWRENHELIEEHELYSDDELELMYSAGKEDARLYKDFGKSYNRKETEAIQKVILRIVRIVSNFKWEDDNGDNENQN